MKMCVIIAMWLIHVKDSFVFFKGSLFSFVCVGFFGDGDNCFMGVASFFIID